MNKIVFVSDFFIEDIVGGGELNDYEVYKLFVQKGYEVGRIRSHMFASDHLDKDAFYVISNFINLNYQLRELLQDYNYIIYEHDHKYIRSRNPALYKNFEAPKDQIINQDFYDNAAAVLCQSNFHMDIVKKNICLDNIVSVGGNVWSLKSLDFMRQISQVEKKNKTSILHSNIEHKNTLGAIEYCIRKNESYELVSDKDYYSFLSKLGKNRKFVFIPKTPETLSRVCVEARMMNMSVVVNSLIGASKEPWYSLKGTDLIDYMIEKREKVVEKIIGIFNEQ
tara:strand:+ start:2617 stop:3456 length:840 start_codon:yes stop_codon:yes gene_type:complete